VKRLGIVTSSTEWLSPRADTSTDPWMIQKNPARFIPSQPAAPSALLVTAEVQHCPGQSPAPAGTGVHPSCHRFKPKDHRHLYIKLVLESFRLTIEKAGRVQRVCASYMVRGYGCLAGSISSIPETLDSSLVKAPHSIRAAARHRRWIFRRGMSPLKRTHMPLL
jgi:hypothetical protein